MAYDIPVTNCCRLTPVACGVFQFSICHFCFSISSIWALMFLSLPLFFFWEGVLLLQCSRQANTVCGSFQFWCLYSQAKHRYAFNLELHETHVLALCLQQIMCHCHQIWVMQSQGKLCLDCLIGFFFPAGPYTYHFLASNLELIGKLVFCFPRSLNMAIKILDQ